MTKCCFKNEPQALFYLWLCAWGSTNFLKSTFNYILIHTLRKNKVYFKLANVKSYCKKLTVFNILKSRLKILFQDEKGVLVNEFAIIKIFKITWILESIATALIQRRWFKNSYVVLGIIWTSISVQTRWYVHLDTHNSAAAVNTIFTNTN